MVFRTKTAALFGLEVSPIEVEIHGKQGIPQFVIIGLASRAVEEAKERITSALQNCEVRIRSKRTVVNLSPAAMPKSGTAFDLAIAVGLLKMYGELQLRTEDTYFFGELALDGQVKSIVGALPLVLGAIKHGAKVIVIPEGNQAELGVVRSVKIHTIRHLNQLLAQPSLPTPQLPPLSSTQLNIKPSPNTPSRLCSVLGQKKAKRALTLTAAGGHNLLFIGPPGIGKTEIARSLPELLPPLTEAESIEVTAIHSIAGLRHDGMITTRPFRSPHHTISRTALIGGGNPLKPGELSLAHHGVLFLDELLEFPSSLLDTLRQPIEEKSIALSFAHTKTVFPAQVTLVAATNPCSCGYYQSLYKSCNCSPRAIEQYRQKLSGPLLDRFDLVVHMDMEREIYAPEKCSEEETGSTLKSNVASCRSQLTGTSLTLAPGALQLLRRESIRQSLSGRKYKSTIRVAQTAAYLNQQEHITDREIEEALSFLPA